MKLLVILSALTVAVTERPAEEIPPWANETRFGNYQKAWKSLTRAETALYYLTNTTYENDALSWGTNFSCVTVKATPKKGTTKVMTSHFAFKNASSIDSQLIYDVEEEVEAVFSYDYEKSENAINYRVPGPINYTDTLIFSDEHCDLFSVPYANTKTGTGGLELWVHEDKLGDIPKHCNFLIQLFKKNGDEVYPKYENEECKEVAKKLRGEEGSPGTPKQ